MISSSGRPPGARTVAVTVTSSPSKQREPDSATSTASSRRRAAGASAPAPPAPAPPAGPARRARSGSRRAARAAPPWPGSVTAGRDTSGLPAGRGARGGDRSVRPKKVFHGCFAGRARWPGPRAATSSPVTCRTHISGRRTRRWASAGTATALMSSGVTYAAAGQRGVAAGQLDHRQRAARRGAHRDLRVGPGRGDQRDHVRSAGPGAAAPAPATPAWPAAGRRR